MTPSRSLALSSGPRGPGRAASRALTFVGAVGVALLLVWALVLLLLWGYAWFRLGGIDLRALDDETAPLGAAGAQAPADAVTVLVTLTESRDPTRPVEPDLVAPVALVQVGGTRDAAAVLLLPNELQVTVDGQGEQSLDEVHAEGGTDLLAQAVIDYTEVRIDHVVSMTVDAMPRLVDLVGTIEFCLPDGCREADSAAVAAGQRDPDPEVVVRTVAGAVRGAAQAFETRSAARSPLTAKRAIDVVAEEFITDVSLRGRELVRVAETLARSVPIAVDTVPVLRNPSTGALIPLDEAAMVRFQHLRDGTPFEARELTDELSAVVAGGVRIAVLNGAGIDGLAGRVEARLIAEGLRSMGTGNAPTFDQATTVVTYTTGDARIETAAILVAELLDDARLEPVPDPLAFEGEEVDLIVTAGSDLDVAD